jgi:hypothetical protein
MKMQTEAIAMQDNSVRRLTVVLVLSLPTLIATMTLAALVSGRFSDLFGPFVFLCFFIASYGPVLLIPAAVLALRITREKSAKFMMGVVAWISVALSAAAGALFHLCLLDRIPTP